MANFANGPTQTAAWINSALGRLGLTDEMLIVPLSGIETAVDMEFMLVELTGFVPAATVQQDFAVGICFLNSKRCVDDALRDLSTGLVNVAEMKAAIDARADTFVEGKTVLVKTVMGQLLVDVALFAAKTGLSMERSLDGAFAVSVHTVDDKSHPGKQRKVFVAVRMQTESSPQSGDPSVAAATISALLPKLEERSRSGFDTIVSHDLAGIGSGEQFALTPGFIEVLGWLRGGHICHVDRNRNGGLYISY